MKFLLALIFTICFAFSVFAQKRAEVAVVSTHLRKSPDINSEKIQTLQKGDQVVLEKSGETNGWYYVSTVNGTVKGWIRKDTIGDLKPAKTLGPQIEKSEKNAVVKTSQNPAPPADSVVETAKNPASSSASADSAPVDSAEPINIEDNEVLRIDTEEVSLNVRVIDGSNRPVKNLNQTDFKIYEDGVLQPLTSLTTAEVPIINALVIDNSRSLRSQLPKVIEAGKIIINTNREKDESTVVRFVSTDKIEVVQEFTPNKNSLNNALDNLFVEGGQTAIIDAIYRTAKMVGQYQSSQKKEDVKLRALILVSDGDDRGSVFQEAELFKLLRDSNVQIYAVGFTGNLSDGSEPGSSNRREKAKSFLTKLAQETGGKVYFPESINELSQIAAEISGELRTQYLLSYVPTNETRDGGFRKIKVEVGEGKNKEKRTAITRSGRNSLPQ